MPMFLSVSLSDTLFMVAVSVASQCVAGGTYTMAMTRLDSTLKLSRTRGAGVTHSTMVICAVFWLPLASHALLSPTLAPQLICCMCGVCRGESVVKPASEGRD